MQQGRIFLLGDNVGTLQPMDETPYPTEDILQELLARYPDLLPGDQITPENPRRWLLVAREMGVPGDVDTSDRWSLDHLFLDQDGMPTFVECKRAVDTRARREVVAQMLDYAANGVVYWDIKRIRQTAAETAARNGRKIDDEVRRLIEAEDDEAVEVFWKAVEENLHGGRCRLIFVADQTPKELRRLVEFLNAKMADVEVLAVEVKQYLGGSQRAMVARVIGLTETTRRTPTPVIPPIDIERFLAASTPEAGQFFRSFLAALDERGHSYAWGRHSFSAKLLVGARPAGFVYGYPPGTLEVYFGYLVLPDNVLQALRARVAALGVFREAGTKTLKTTLSEEVLKRGDQIASTLLQILDEYRAAHRQQDHDREHE
jgi:ribosomal protein L30E